MKTRMGFRLLAVLAMAAFVFTSCDDDDDNKVETPQGIVDVEVNGVEDLDVETLTAVLLSHVVEGNVVAVDVSSGSVPTLNAEKQLFNMVVCTKRFKFVPLF